MSEAPRSVASTGLAEEFEDLFEHAPCGYLTMTPDGRIVRANTLLSTWTGYPTDQIVGKRLHDLLTIGTRILFETHFAPHLNLHGLCEEMSLDLRTATGEIIAVSASGRIRHAVDGQPVVTCMTFLKAAERRRYEQQLVEARARSQALEQATQQLLEAERVTSELREQFIAVLGHDLRNPLGAILSGLRLLQREKMVERRERLFDMLEGSVRRMAELIDNVMDFARGRLGAGIPLDLRPEVALTPVLDQVVAELQLGDAGRTITTEFDLPVPVRCDPSRLSQLVSNLLGNALTHGAVDQPIRVHADQADGLTIWVANGGEPIPPAAMERLFQPFFRGEVRPSQQGLGLGLHIAFEIAKAHGGILCATSTPEETRFTFQMPMPA